MPYEQWKNEFERCLQARCSRSSADLTLDMRSLYNQFPDDVVGAVSYCMGKFNLTDFPT